jgi:hypothetical protein
MVAGRHSHLAKQSLDFVIRHPDHNRNENHRNSSKQSLIASLNCARKCLSSTAPPWATRVHVIILDELVGFNIRTWWIVWRDKMYVPS